MPCSALKVPEISVIIPILLEFSALACKVESNKIIKNETEKFFFMLSVNIVKKFIIVLLLYSVFNILILFSPITSIQGKTYSFSTFNYKQLLNYPNYYKLLYSKNKEYENLLEKLFEKEKKNSYLDAQYWKHRLIFTKKKQVRSNAFYNMVTLYKNNQIKKTSLNNFYIKNLNFFTDSYKVKIKERL